MAPVVAHVSRHALRRAAAPPARLQDRPPLLYRHQPLLGIRPGSRSATMSRSMPARSIQNHLFEDRIMKSSYLTIEHGCSVGNMSVVLYDTRMEEGCQARPHVPADEGRNHARGQPLARHPDRAQPAKASVAALSCICPKDQKFLRRFIQKAALSLSKKDPPLRERYALGAIRTRGPRIRTAMAFATALRRLQSGLSLDHRPKPLGLARRVSTPSRRRAWLGISMMRVHRSLPRI